MKDCYALLGISAAAPSDEIEEAYRRKKIEFEADAFALRELESAYNEAIMATFAPIRAFAATAPLPVLETGKKSPPVSRPEPAAAPAQDAHDWYGPVQAEPFRAEPVSLSDTELMNMDVSQLRDSMPQEEAEKPGFLSLGIENRLLRYYARTYILMTAFDMVMRLCAGPEWLVLTETVNPREVPAIPLFLLALLAFVSTAYCFVCSLPLPFAARFFLLGQPPYKEYVLCSMVFLAVVAAFTLRRFTGLVLPLSVVGSSASFILTAMLLSLGTLRYTGG